MNAAVTWRAGALLSAIVFVLRIIPSVYADAADADPDRVFANNFEKPPVADFIWNGSGLKVLFVDQSTDEGSIIDSYFWDFGDGTTSTERTVFNKTYASAGTYTVTHTVLDSRNGQSVSKTKTATVANFSCGFPLTLYLHDFKAYGEDGGHPDFEHFDNGLVTGLVKSIIDPDGVPSLKSTTGSGSVPSITNAESFSQWFTDDPINQSIQQTLTFSEISGEKYEYNNNAYFPIDNVGFGNYQPYMSGLHNYHFTATMRAVFRYSSGAFPTFSFTGNDDVWLYINGHLIIDMGGVHDATTGNVTMNASTAALLGVVDGQLVRLDFFMANRHTPNSQFKMTQSGLCLNDAD
jgi:fibro-slime domain-containing protein